MPTNTDATSHTNISTATLPQTWPHTATRIATHTATHTATQTHSHTQFPTHCPTQTHTDAHRHAFRPKRIHTSARRHAGTHRVPHDGPQTVRQALVHLQGSPTHHHVHVVSAGDHVGHADGGHGVREAVLEGGAPGQQGGLGQWRRSHLHHLQAVPCDGHTPSVGRGMHGSQSDCIAAPSLDRLASASSTSITHERF